FDIDLRSPGKTFSAIQGRTSLFIGVIGNGASLTADSTPGAGAYTTVGNASCRGNNPTPTPTPTATPTPSPSPSPSGTPTPTPTNAAPRYYNYAPPPAVGENAGEPTIGYNPASGRAMFIAGLQTLRVTFPSQSEPEAAPAQWQDVSSIITRTRSLDPILF